MMKMKRLLAVATALFLVASTLAGCRSSGASGGTTNSASPKVLDKVVIGTQEMPNDEGIAKALNYFSQEMNVKVELKQFDSGKDVNTALAAGSIDFGLLGSCPAALAISQNLGVECIWIHEILGPTESLVARSDTGVKSIKDLKGKTIATPFASTSHFSLLHALESAGLKDSDVKLLDMQPAEIYAAWQNKQIDATYIWEPTLSQLKNSTLLCTSADMAKEGYMTSNVELVRTAFAKGHPDVVTNYIKAVAKAVDLYKNDTDKAVSTIATKLKLSDSDAKKQMSGSSWLTTKEQLGAQYFGTSSAKGALAKNFYDTASFLKDQKSIQTVPDMSVFKNAVNPEFIEAALK